MAASCGSVGASEFLTGAATLLRSPPAGAWAHLLSLAGAVVLRPLAVRRPAGIIARPPGRAAPSRAIISACQQPIAPAYLRLFTPTWRGAEMSFASTMSAGSFPIEQSPMSTASGSVMRES